jgi:hypothetical protein
MIQIAFGARDAVPDITAHVRIRRSIADARGSDDGLEASVGIKTPDAVVVPVGDEGAEGVNSISAGQ